MWSSIILGENRINCTACGAQLADGAKFCASCGTPVGSTGTENQRRQVYEGEIRKCPSCGQPLESFQAVCPSCGHELRNVKVSSALQNFYNKLNNASDNEKAHIISIFPIPNTKEDFMEFLFMAKGEVEKRKPSSDDKDLLNIYEAWESKYEQLKAKSYVLFRNDTVGMSQVNNLLSNTKKKKIGKLSKIGIGFLIVGIWLLLVLFLGIGDLQKEKSEKNKIENEISRLEAIVLEIQNDIDSENYDAALLKVDKVRWTLGQPGSILDSADNKVHVREWENRRYRLEQIIEERRQK